MNKRPQIDLTSNNNSKGADNSKEQVVKRDTPTVHPEFALQWPFVHSKISKSINLPKYNNLSIFSFSHFVDLSTVISQQPQKRDVHNTQPSGTKKAIYTQ